MEFRRLGHVFQPAGNRPWAHSHAANPFAVPDGDGHLEVYFATRDDANRSHIASISLRRGASGFAVVGEPRLELEPGPDGAFDEHGVSMGSVVDVGGDRFLFYLGWQLQDDVPWRNTIGLAIRRHGAPRFEKIGERPILGLSDVDPHSVSYPTVTADDGWVMWYGTNLRWGATPDSMEHAIRRAVSDDGLNWVPDDELAVDIDRGSGEFAIARPAVIRRGDSMVMAFGSRRRDVAQPYRIAIVTSEDGRTWQRRSDPTWTGDAAAWESEMTCYPDFVRHGDQTLLAYCGNGFGATGFGLAEVRAP